MKTPKSFTASSEATTRPSQDAIARRAYEIWVQEGRPDGCDHEHWREAERQLVAEFGGDRSEASRRSRRTTDEAADDKIGSKLDDVASPYSAFGDDAALPVKVDRKIGNTRRTQAPRSPTSVA